MIKPLMLIKKIAKGVKKKEKMEAVRLKGTDYTEESVTGSANIQKQLFDRNLFLSAGGSYSRINGLVDTNAYSANGSLVWKIGKVDLTVGASAYGSDSSIPNTISTHRDHELVYVKFRRRLF